MRDVSPALQAHLDAGATTLAKCWRVTLAGGAVRGFTEHDRDLSFGATLFRAATGFAGSAIAAQLGLAVGDSEIAGVLSDEGIDAGELEAGLYDGARVETFLVNWSDAAQRVLLSVAEIGEVRRGAHAFEAELKSVAARLNVAVGRTFQPVCDAVLGDARCGVDLGAPGRHGAGVVSAPGDGRVLGVAGLDGFPAERLAGGVLTWTSGANAGLTAELRGGDAGTLELWRAAARAVEAGDAFTLTAGCDKRLATCRAAFGNGANFRGFPFMPGNDWIAASPASGERHDGASLFS
mgnify:CR=1 FL=1